MSRGRSEFSSRCLFASVLLCVIVATAGGGEAVAVQPSSAEGGRSSRQSTVEAVPYRHFTSQDGLPHASVRHLAQTPDGRLWIGTDAGLAVYDGHRVRTVALPDSIGPEAVGNFFVQRDGTLWVEVVELGIVALRDGHVTRVLPAPKEPNNVARLLTRGDTLFVVTSSALWTLPPEADAFEKTPYTFAGKGGAEEARSVRDSRVVAADRAPDGTIWVAVSDRGLGRLSPDGTVTFADVSLPKGNDPDRLNLRFADDGSALVTTWAGAYRFIPSAPEIRKLSSIRYPRLFAQDSTVYSVRTNRVKRWNFHTGRTRTFQPEDGLPSGQYYTVLEDEAGGLWVGTLRGLLYLPAPTARNLTAIGGTSIRWATHFSVDASREAVWVATWGRGLFRLSPSPMHAPPQRASGERFDVLGRWSVLVRRSNGVNALSAAGWFRRTDAGWHRVHPTIEATNGYIDTTGAGVFWTNHGLCRVRPTPSAPVDTLWHWDYDDASLHGLHPVDDGHLLLRTRGHLVRLSPYNKAGADTVASFPQYSATDAQRMVVLNDRAWLGSGGKGLIGIAYRGDTTRTTRLLPNTRVHSLSIVGDSLLLAGTDTGLYLLDPKTGSVRRHLTTADGLLSNTAGGRFFRDTLYVAHPYGLTTLPRSVVQSAPRPPSPKITSWSVNEGERRIPVDSARLTVEKRTLTFRFTGVHLAKGTKVRHAYRLIPYDTTWHTTQDHLTRYTDLPPGTYDFQVRARLKGASASAPTSLHFTIPRAFYETTWFRLLCGLGVLGLIGGGYLLRVRVLRRRQEELQALVAERTRRLAKEKEKTEEQAERLAALDEEKNRFFTNISHELRTPLTLLIGILEDALDGAFGAVPASLRQQLEIVREHAHRIRRLTEQLLDLSRLESTEPDLDVERRDLVAFIRRLVHAFVPLAERGGVGLELDTDLDVHPCRFDPDKLEKVVGNLMSNALKFTPAGGQVTVRLDAEPSDAKDDPPVAVVSVTDTGPGIPDDRQDEIFDRFVHSSPRGEDQTGTGIGLALAREFVRMHDGTIDLDSTPEVGSTFILRLPLPVVDPGEVEAPPPDRTPSSVSAAGPLSLPPSENDRPADESSPTNAESESDRPLLLVVDDNADVRAYLRRHLSGVGRVVEASDGAEGLEAVRNEEPDLILADVMMPNVDGLALTRRLREDDALDRIPILLLTARAAERDAVEGLEAGADDYVTKPFSSDALRARVQQLLSARRAWTSESGAAGRVLTPDVDVTPAEETFLERVTEAVEDNLSRSAFTVEDLASEVGISPRQLQRKLKRLTGHTAAAFVRRYRLECAAEMLTGGAGSVSQVAHRVGFGTPETFVKHFQNHFDCRPSAYADRHSAGPSPSSS